MNDYIVKIDCRVRATVNGRRTRSVRVSAENDKEAAKEAALDCALEGFEVLGVREVHQRSPKH